jgi:hypothetical protein
MGSLAILEDMARSSRAVRKRHPMINALAARLREPKRPVDWLAAELAYPAVTAEDRRATHLRVGNAPLFAAKLYRVLATRQPTIRAPSTAARHVYTFSGTASVVVVVVVLVYPMEVEAGLWP